MTAGRHQGSKLPGSYTRPQRTGKPLTTDRLPLWVRDKKGKYQVFPVHLLGQRYGKWGFFYSKVFGDGADNPYWQMWLRYRFTEAYNQDTFVYLLDDSQ